MRVFVTKIKPIIECFKCGMLTECGNMTIDLWVDSFDELYREASNRMPDIPVGWTSNGWNKGRRDFRCTTCGRTGNENGR
jgi:hypothetical protein